jgi:regulator of protease activity HflC (stomatin/prohibitin superfamily)
MLVVPKPSSAEEAAKAPKAPKEHHISSIEVTIGLLILAVSALIAKFFNQPLYLIPGVLIGAFAAHSVQVARQWEKAIVLRFGKFHKAAGPGLFFIIPIVDTIAAWVDHRVITTPFKAEQTLTKDTVPVDVDAVLFWVVWDAEKAAMEVADYKEAVAWAAQTALRDVIGRTMLADMLVGREKLDAELQRIIDQRTTPWGITVQSVEIRDIIIPSGLQDAMSRQAQAERERQARLILGEAETQIAQSFVQAGAAYANNPIALHLRAMNMLYEGLKEKGALVVVPSTAVESMGLGTITGLAAIRQSEIPGLKPEEKQSD